MASIDDLKTVLKETLDNRGVLNQMRARIRAEVFSALDDQIESKPILSNENMLINELIREYLEFNMYKYSNTVLLAESGQPKEPIDRNFLAAELNITESVSSKKLPILYGLVSFFLEQRNSSAPERDTSDQVPSKYQVRSTRNEPDLSELIGDCDYQSKNGLIYHAKK